MDIKQIIGNNIRGYRTKISWSQEKLAVRAHTHSNYLGTIERGVQNASVDILYNIAKALKIEPFKLWIEDSYKE